MTKIIDFSYDSEAEAPTTPDESTVEPVVRRSARERCPPNYYGMERSYSSIQSEPTSVEEATTCPDGSVQWSLR